MVPVSVIEVDVPVRYGTEDIPSDFPLRVGDRWKAFIDLKTGQISDWPKGKSGNLYMKVVDEGTYTLWDDDGKVVKKIEDCYVPNTLIPGEYGDYIDLKINDEGIITNWKKTLSFEDFEDLDND